MSSRAWVTLATNDSYGLGALVLAHSLRRAGSAYPAVVLITPSVTEAMSDRLRAVFAEVVIVDVLDSKDAAHLALLQRPELGITFTKIHCWNLTQYEKCVFLDADTLIIQNCDELFEREELSAAPDVGWPDCFNSGVFVFKPSAETFDSLIKFAQERGSFDGGDQGLLNSYFSDWAHGDINKHLPFLYNVTSAAFYSYLPALKHYGQNLKIIHFIGATKPWLQQFNWETRTAEAPQHLREFLQLWWDIFVGHVHSVLDISMVEIEEALPAASSQETFHEPRLDYPHYEPILDPESEFPWHHPDAQIPDAEINVPEIDMTQFHDPWDIYRGHIPPNIEDTSSHQIHRQIESQKAENHEDIRKYAWDYLSPQHHQPNISRPDMQTMWHHENTQQTRFEHTEHSQDDSKGNVWDYNPQCNYNQDQRSLETSINQVYFDKPAQIYEHSKQDHTNQFTEAKNSNYTSSTFNQLEDDLKHHSANHIHGHTEHTHENITSHFTHSVNAQKYTPQLDHYYALNSHKDVEKNHYPTYTQQHRVEHIYHVHLDHERVQKKIDNNDIESESEINGDGELDNEVFENLTPRHPYDGYYLRHRMTIDSRGRKICTHEVPPIPSPSPPESPTPLENCDVQSTKEYELTPSNDTEDQTGVAGNLARVVLGIGAQREALDDLTRRQGWEAGNIDYMGADAFDNIWAKISQTLSQPRSSPPKQSTPPPQPAEVPAPPAPVEVPPPILEAPAAQAPAETPAIDPAPIPLEASTLIDPPVPSDAFVLLPEEIPVPAETPVFTVGSVITEVVAPVKVAEDPESPTLSEAPVETKTPELVIPPELDFVKTAPITSSVPAPAPEPAEVVAAVVPTEEPKPAAPAEVPVVETPTATAPAVAVESSAAIPSIVSEANKQAEDAAPAVPPKVATAPTAAVTPSKPEVPKPEVTPVNGASTTDSPPLANTPSKEEVPIVPAAKSEERRKPAEKLQLHPPAAADPLPTPDSELEDAAALAHAIISSELRTPTVTSPSPPADPASPRPPLAAQRLSVEEPELPTPPVGAVSLSQIGVKPQPKGKSTTAAQIESSITEVSADAPKKKVVKKVLKKEGAAGSEAPVPPPRKKEKKPKDK